MFTESPHRQFAVKGRVMKSSSSHWRRIATVVVLALCVAQFTLSQIVPKRRIRVELTGEVGDSVIAIVTVDGVPLNLEKKLPVLLEYKAKELKLDARFSDSKSKNPLAASRKVDDVEVGHVRTGPGQGVKAGYKAPGVFGLGSSETTISAVPTENTETSE